MMKLSHIHLHADPSESFILYREKKPFDSWHYHPEYELVYILKGRGKRMVGDNVERFRENDLVFMGSNLPHEWLCDKSYYAGDNNFLAQGLVLQFRHDFLGDKFFNIAENIRLKRFMDGSQTGYSFYGETKKQIIELMLKMENAEKTDRLYDLLGLFRIFSFTHDYKPLSTKAYIHTYRENISNPMDKAQEYILENFQQQVQLEDLLSLTNMSNTSFYLAFKKTYKMSYKEYLLRLRVGYACKLLTSDYKNITEVAFDSGFQNLSNFNRQFKKIKGITPGKFLNDFKNPA